MRYEWDETVRRLQRDTRHFAKRQLTWFRSDPSVHWLTIEEEESVEQIAKRALAHLGMLGVVNAQAPAASVAARSWPSSVQMDGA